MTDSNKVPLTIRLRPEDKETFVKASEEAGLEPSVAARQLMDLVIRRLREDDDLMRAMLDVRNGLQNRGGAAAR
jgi:hypothetical protein